MQKIGKIRVSTGIFWVEVPEENFYMVCGCPEDTVKHLMRRGLIVTREQNGVVYESGPEAILFSDIFIQNGSFSNLGEFPVLQMLYRQGMIIPNHPNNTGRKPLLVGAREQLEAQMKYIYSGNYGLANKDEILSAGVDAETADMLYRLKLRFAFGKIKNTDELVDTLPIGKETVEIRNGITITRLRMNVFKIAYKNESVIIDLNLKEDENYECPFKTGFHNIKREYFAVIHSGEGDGWNIHKPSMSSIIMFHGKIYLIDAGPNIISFLNSLGINVNEIEGIFHTHCHDDHFAGLPALMRADHKIKYFATPLVCKSVGAKLGALISAKSADFENFFDITYLKEGEWNDVQGMEVKPVFTPHPVENTIFIFRSLSGKGLKTFGHFADLTDLSLLKKMITSDQTAPGISAELFESVKENYLVELNLKKVDVGGGMIHGNASDFIKDKTAKILLAHISGDFTDGQKQIGSGAPFGMTDILIPSHHEFTRSSAYIYLKSYFPNISHHFIEMLLNNPIVNINPESIIIKNGEIPEHVYLVLTGNIEMLNQSSGIKNILSAGALIGDYLAFEEAPAEATFRAMSFSQMLKIPLEFYREFILKNNLKVEIRELNRRRRIFNRTGIFADGISSKIQNKIAQAIEIIECEGTQCAASSKDSPGLYLLVSGRARIMLENDIIENLEPGGFWGETRLLYNMNELFKIKLLEPSVIYFAPREILTDIPIIYWKIREVYERRMKTMLNPDFVSKSIFKWYEDYKVGIAEIDEQHKKLIVMADILYKNIITNKNKTVILNSLKFLLDYTNHHFSNEEIIMGNKKYPELDKHKKLHVQLIEQISMFELKFEKNNFEIIDDFIDLLKEWIIGHILTEDRKFSAYLKR